MFNFSILIPCLYQTFSKKLTIFVQSAKKFSIFGLHLILFHPAVGEPLSACLPVGRGSRMRTATEGRPYVSQITVSKEFHLSL
jgi:hypothetical protein